MGRRIIKVDYRVVVTPNVRVDEEYRYLSKKGTSGLDCVEKSEAVAIPQCETIQAQIRRHIDNVGSVAIDYDIKELCEFCGCIWTEGNSSHNGGCCKQDEAIMLAEDPKEIE